MDKYKVAIYYCNHCWYEKRVDGVAQGHCPQCYNPMRFIRFTEEEWDKWGEIFEEEGVQKFLERFNKKENFKAWDSNDLIEKEKVDD